MSNGTCIVISKFTLSFEIAMSGFCPKILNLLCSMQYLKICQFRLQTAEIKDETPGWTPGRLSNIGFRKITTDEESVSSEVTELAFSISIPLDSPFYNQSSIT